MNGNEILILALLSFSALVCIGCSLAILLMRGFYDKLHFLAPPSILGTAAVAAAIIVKEGIASGQGIKSLLVFAVLLVSGPAITHVAAQTRRVRETGVAHQPSESDQE
ncbi:MAG: monovalent cation/H(+) antiporter subunit G [Desulfobacteraceae bacterium]|nr:monovalent cation/H(+) antiporter subunit G [Desulfobacteraceae bacterium]